MSGGYKYEVTAVFLCDGTQVLCSMQGYLQEVQVAQEVQRHPKENKAECLGQAVQKKPAYEPSEHNAHRCEKTI